MCGVAFKRAPIQRLRTIGVVVVDQPVYEALSSEYSFNSSLRPHRLAPERLGAVSVVVVDQPD